MIGFKVFFKSYIFDWRTDKFTSETTAKSENIIKRYEISSLETDRCVLKPDSIKKDVGVVMSVVKMSKVKNLRLEFSDFSRKCR